MKDRKIDELEKMLGNLTFLDARRLFIISILRDFDYDYDRELGSEYDYELKDHRLWNELTQDEKLSIISMVEEVYYDTDTYNLGTIVDCVMTHKLGVIKDDLGLTDIVDILNYEW